MSYLTCPQCQIYIYRPALKTKDNQQHPLKLQENTAGILKGVLKVKSSWEWVVLHTHFMSGAHQFLIFYLLATLGGEIKFQTLGIVSPTICIPTHIKANSLLFILWIKIENLERFKNRDGFRIDSNYKKCSQERWLRYRLQSLIFWFIEFSWSDSGLWLSHSDILSWPQLQMWWKFQII